jgi:hypothetical protein
MKKYIFLFAFILVLISFTLYLHDAHADNRKLSGVAGDKFYKVLFSQKNDAKLIEEIDSNWEHLAKFERAFNHISNSTPTDAASVYNDLSSKEVSDVLRELAQYLEVMSSFSLDSDKMDNEKVNNLGQNFIYPYSNKEAIALFKIRNNDIQDATKILHSLLNDKKCPTLIKANAQELLHVYQN